VAKTRTKNIPDTSVQCQLKPNYLVLTALFYLTGQKWFTGHKPREFTGGLFGYVRWSHRKCLGMWDEVTGSVWVCEMKSPEVLGYVRWSHWKCLGMWDEVTGSVLVCEMKSPEVFGYVRWSHQKCLGMLDEVTGRVWVCEMKSPEEFGYVRWSHRKRWDSLCSDLLMKLISYLSDCLTVDLLVVVWWFVTVCYVDSRLHLGKATWNCTEKVSPNISVQVFAVIFWVFTP
jgi:hypothetical protein